MSNFLFLLILTIVFYYIYNSYLNFQRQGKKFDKENQNTLLEEYKLIIALTAKVAKSDGIVSELEAELVSNTLDDLSNEFKNPTQVREILKDIFKKEKEISSNIKELSREYLYLTRDRYDKRIKALSFLINIAFIDRVLTKEEEDILDTISIALEIDNLEYKKLLDSFKTFYSSNKSFDNIKDDLKKSYAILGLQEGVSFNEVKKRYRELVKKYHPDIIKGKGYGEDKVLEATKILQEINAAYEKIKKYKT